MRRSVPRLAGPAAALLALALDQLSKLALIDLLATHPDGIAVLPVFNLVMV